MPEIFLPRIASHTIRGFFIAEKEGRSRGPSEPTRDLGEFRELSLVLKIKTIKSHRYFRWSFCYRHLPGDLGSPEGYAPLVAAATSPPLPRPRVLPALWWRQQRRRHYHARGCYPPSGGVSRSKATHTPLSGSGTLPPPSGGVSRSKATHTPLPGSGTLPPSGGGSNVAAITTPAGATRKKHRKYRWSFCDLLLTEA